MRGSIKQSRELHQTDIIGPGRVFGRPKITPPIQRKVKLGYWVKHILSASIIIAILIFVIINFYILASINLSGSFYIFLIFSLITDGLFIIVQTLRRKAKHENIYFDPAQLTVVIACYNGQDVIGETINQVLRHVPREQVIVVSDASTDNTEQIVRKSGVQLIVNETNINKVLSIDCAMKEVTTPYVLLLDDDVLIGDITIPTSLLDDGFTAVAFNVMPVKSDSWVNKLQVFEYRNSMQIGKNLRARSGGIGNVSGAIGLYRTEDILRQATLHSNQFAGEDEQRTILAHLYGSGKGITYTDQTVLTHAPETFGKLYRQRAHSWSLALPELFTLYWRLIFSPKTHYLLKGEKAYYLYIYLTDPLRILFLWLIIMRPQKVALLYAFYLFFSVWVWVRMKFKDDFTVVLAYPLYKLWLTLCRFVGNFIWFKHKFGYLRQKLHTRVVQRRLKNEYALVSAVFVVLWGMSLYRNAHDIELYRKIQLNRLEEPAGLLQYEQINQYDKVSSSSLNLPVTTLNTQNTNDMMMIDLQKGDTDRALAYRAVDHYASSRPLLELTYEQRMRATNNLVGSLQKGGVYASPNGTLFIQNYVIELAIESARQAEGASGV